MKHFQIFLCQIECKEGVSSVSFWPIRVISYQNNQIWSKNSFCNERWFITISILMISVGPWNWCFSITTMAKLYVALFKASSENDVSIMITERCSLSNIKAFWSLYVWVCFEFGVITFSIYFWFACFSIVFVTFGECRDVISIPSNDSKRISLPRYRSMCDTQGVKSQEVFL